MRLSSGEVRRLVRVSPFARALYAVCTRPYADEHMGVLVSEDDLMGRMARICHEGDLSLALVKQELEALVERGLISRAYSQQAYRIVAGLH